MTMPNNSFILQSPQTMTKGEAISFVFDFANVGTPTAVNSLGCFDSDGNNHSADLSGANTISGDTVQSEKFTPADADHFRLIMNVTIDGNTVISLLDVAVGDPTPVATPALAAASYGSVAGVADLVPKHVNRSGNFDDTTHPTNQTVVNYINEISSIINMMLATEGFATPVTDSDVTPSFDLFVNQEVAAIVEGINGSGRFGPTVVNRKGGGAKSRFQLIFEDVENFITKFAIGLERSGATRTYDFADQIGYRSTDESGDTVQPIFQREGFGDTYKNWDS